MLGGPGGALWVLPDAPKIKFKTKYIHTNGK